MITSIALSFSFSHFLVGCQLSHHTCNFGLGGQFMICFWWLLCQDLYHWRKFPTTGMMLCTWMTISFEKKWAHVRCNATHEVRIWWCCENGVCGSIYHCFVHHPEDFQVFISHHLLCLLVVNTFGMASLKMHFDWHLFHLIESSQPVSGEFCNWVLWDNSLQYCEHFMAPRWSTFLFHCTC